MLNIQQLARSIVEPRRENWSVSVLAGATSTIWTYTVPCRSRLRLKSLGNYLGTVAAWGSVTWRLLCNGMPVTPYDAILDQIGYAAQRQTVQELEFGGSSVVSIVATNGTLAAVNIGVSVEFDLIHEA